MKATNEGLSIREAAMKWWDGMNLENQFYATIKHNDLIAGDRTRHPDILNGNEIERIYKAETSE